MTDQDANDFEQRLRECHRAVYQVAYSVLRDRADAEEVTQDAFLRAYQKFASLREPQKFRYWTARMSFRLALNRRRAMARARQRDASWFEAQTRSAENVEADLIQRDFLMRLQQAIEHLPEKLRAALALSAVQELNSRDVAEMLRIPEGTVRSRLHLARKELLREFGDETM